MGLSDEEKRARRRIYNQKYRSTEKGKQATKESILRYQQGEKYKQLKRQYYLNNKVNIPAVNPVLEENDINGN
jgi:hypothetical protein